MTDDNKDSDLAARLARAEAAVADLAKSYISWATADVEKCAEFLASARAAPHDPASPSGIADDRMTAMQALYAIAHNIKGQGSSFGFQLMTRLGDSLCLLTRAKRPFPEADLNLVAAHLDAMRLVLTQEIRGDGGALGDKLAQRLETLVAQARALAQGSEDASTQTDLIR